MAGNDDDGDVLYNHCGVSEYYMLYYLSLIYWAQSRNNRDLVQIYTGGFSCIHAIKVPMRL